jgi:hypothetical protein
MAEHALQLLDGPRYALMEDGGTQLTDKAEIFDCLIGDGTQPGSFGGG